MTDKFYVIPFGPTCKCKNASKAAKTFRDYFGISNRLGQGEATYLKEGFAYLSDNFERGYRWEKICTTRDIETAWFARRGSDVVIIGGKYEYIGLV